jgi:hypothetical protein
MVMIFTGVSQHPTEVDEEILVPALVVGLQEAFKVCVLTDDAQYFGVFDDLVRRVLPSP